MAKSLVYTSSDISLKNINRLAIPAIITGIAEPILSITDTAIVGNVPVNATEALAAVGIAGSFISAIIWILAQTRTAISATIAKYLGAKKLRHVLKLPSQIIFFNLILSLIIYGLTSYFAYTIFGWYNAKGVVLDQAVSYYKIRALGYPLTLFAFAIFGVFRGMQNTFWPMVISIVGVILNIALDLILVFGIDTLIEPMHVEGAAWASVIAQAVMALMALVLFIKKTPFSFKIEGKFHPEIPTIVSLSFNLFLRTLFLNIALYFANAYATKYGNQYIAAQTIAFQIWLFFAFFIDGYSSVGNIMSGKLLGEEDFFSMKKLSIRLNKVALVISVFLIVVCAIFYQKIGVVFSKEEAVLSSFKDVFWIVLLMQPINVIAFIFDGIFKGLSEASILRNLLAAATFFGFIPSLLLGDYLGWKLYGIWFAFFVWMLIRGGVLIIIFKRKYLAKIT
ncbi:MATE family efflux transporter DinF [Urechidicola sp. KH5]